MPREFGDFEFGIGWAAALPPDDFPALAAHAEELGFDRLVVYNDMLFAPPVPPLLDMARATSRIDLCIGCLNPYTMHPFEIAGHVAYLDSASSGRVTYGLVRGAWLDQIGFDQHLAITAVREASEIVGKVLRGEDDGYEGKVFTIAPGLKRFYEVERERVPLQIGTWSPKMGRLAGEIADEVEIGGSSNPDMVGVVRDHLRPGCAAVGRDADRVPIGLNLVCVIDADGDAARKVGRNAAAMYVDVVAPFDTTLDLDPEFLHRLKALIAAGEVEAAGAMIPDDLLSKFVVCGTPSEVIEHLQAIRDAGAQRVDTSAPSGLSSEKQGMELLAREVVPALRGG
jgi:5,10-methylenetetrahydromethanopterin reductase